MINKMQRADSPGLWSQVQHFGEQRTCAADTRKCARIGVCRLPQESWQPFRKAFAAPGGYLGGNTRLDTSRVLGNAAQ